jgi:hypothetical protein
MNQSTIIRYLLVVLVLGSVGWFLVYTIKKNTELEIKLEQSQKVEEVNTKIRKDKERLDNDTKSLKRADIIRGLCYYKWVRDPENCPD